MLVWFLMLSENSNFPKMSVTNEEVSVPASGGGCSIPPTTTPSTSSTTVASGSSLLLNGPSSSAPTSISGSTVDVVRSGYLRKLKGKKKFFVLRKESGNDRPARLEYYDKEKKFKTGQPPKKSIVLKACFNISRTDSKCKYSIALHTANDCVRIALSSEEEMNDWLRMMNSLAGEEEEDQVDNYLPQSNSSIVGSGKPHFEHIWLVTALNKGLGSKENIIGPYRLCLTSKEVTLLKVGEHDGRNGVVKIPLSVIRNVSHDATFGCFFHIELGRLAPTGPGLLSLKTEDNNIAQNMHLLILKAMQNYSKEDLIPRDRDSRRRTYTWNNDQSLGSRTSSFHNSSAPPGMSRLRTDSMSSTFSTKTTGTSGGGFGMSPPMAVPNMSHQQPSFAFNSPLCSTGTDSASSSYSIDYDNNNHHPATHGSQRGSSNLYSGGGSSGETGYSKSQEEDESYVPWNPSDEQQTSLNSLSSLTLPLNQDTSDYVETSLGSKDCTSSTAQTPSSYMEMQSPMSPFDNYMPMSPGCSTSASNLKNPVSGKISVSHSRNSSLIEEHDGYVPMNPSAHNTRCESGGCSTAGSTTGLDDQYLDMDFGRKLNLSNEDVRRMSPASSESIQSGTPSSDFPLEKVSSYLTDDFDDTNSMRPARAYSVGSRSDTSSIGKRSGSGKNRLEAVQECRTRAMSVGSKMKRPFINPNSALYASPVSGGGKSPAPPLSSSWSGSTGRWPPKFAALNLSNVPHHGQIPVCNSQASNMQPSHNHTGSESNDSDLMELDFSHNKSKSRKRSLPGPNNGNQPSTPTGGSVAGSCSNSKISPVPTSLLNSGSGSETPSTNSDGYAIMEPPKSAIITTTNCIMNGVGSAMSSSPKYTSSAPISIQRSKNSGEVVTYQHSSPGTGSSILTKMTGMDLKKLKELDDEGSYLDMDFSNKKTSTSTSATDTQYNSQQKTNFASTHQETISNLKNSFLNRQPDGQPVVVRANESPSACKMSRFSVNSTPSTPTLSDHYSHHHPPLNYSHHHSLSFGGTTSKSEMTPSTSSTLVRSLSNSSNLSTISAHSNSSSNSSMSVKTQQEVEAALRISDSTLIKSGTTHSPLHNSHHSSSSLYVMDHSNTLPPTTSSNMSGLTKIEEIPEKQPTPLQSPPRSPTHPSPIHPSSHPSIFQPVSLHPSPFQSLSLHPLPVQPSPPPLDEVAYAKIDHFPPNRRQFAGPGGSSSCGSTAVSQSKASSVTYAQIDFVKNTETIAPN